MGRLVKDLYYGISAFWEGEELVGYFGFYTADYFRSSLAETLAALERDELVAVDAADAADWPRVKMLATLADNRAWAEIVTRLALGTTQTRSKTGEISPQLLTVI